MNHITEWQIKVVDHKVVDYKVIDYTIVDLKIVNQSHRSVTVAVQAIMY